MAKSVKSTDERKSAIVSKLKQESGANKITNVTEISLNRFEGDCLVPEIVTDGGFRVKTGKYTKLGRYFVEFETNRDGSLATHVNGGKINEGEK